MVHQLLPFAVATLILNLTPGNNMILIISKSVSYGVRAGLISVIGVAVACIIHVGICVIGLSQLAASSANLMTIIKLLGAAFLVYLGCRSLLSISTLKLKSYQDKQAEPSRKSFFDGMIANLLNAQLIIFFISFLPQFINYEEGNIYRQLLFLGLWYAFSSTVINSIVALLFGSATDLFRKSPRYLKIIKLITGLLLILLGVKLVFQI